MKAFLQSNSLHTFGFFKKNILNSIKRNEIVKSVSPKSFEFKAEQVQQVFKKAMLADRSQIKNSPLTYYLDGKKINSSTTLNKQLGRIIANKDWPTSLGNFPHSVQIRNVHRMSADLYQFCLNFNQFMNWDYYLNVNLYMTPGFKRNCLVFHSDPHVSMIYQVHGIKNWLFPYQKSACLSNHNPMRPLPSFESKSIKTQLLKTNEWLFIPEGAIHKAEYKGGEPSIHLTFSLMTNWTHQGLANIFKEQIENQLDLQNMKFKNFDSNKLSQLLKRSNDVFKPGKIDSLVRARNIFEFKNDLGLNQPQ